jgi:uncharacterized membrane protein YfcA
MNMHNALAGLLVGCLVGMTGMGGSSLMAPILILIFHFKAKYAIGSDLAYAAIAKVFGSAQHIRAANVDFNLVTRLAVFSVPSSLVGVWVVHSIDKRLGAAANKDITMILGAVLVLVAIILMARSIPQIEQFFQRRETVDAERGIAWALGVGAVGGFLVGLTSVGAGTLFGVALLFVYGVKPRKMVGTDIVHACVLSSVAALGHVWAGDVDYGLVGSLLIGAIPGILIGGALSTRMPEGALRPTLGTVLLLSGLKML